MYSQSNIKSMFHELFSLFVFNLLSEFSCVCVEQNEVQLRYDYVIPKEIGFIYDAALSPEKTRIVARTFTGNFIYNRPSMELVHFLDGRPMVIKYGSSE